MLVFIDESGDPGLKLDSGSSEYFIVTLVAFEDNAEALAADQRIQQLKGERPDKKASALSFRNAHHTVTVRAEACIQEKSSRWRCDVNSFPGQTKGHREVPVAHRRTGSPIPKPKDPYTMNRRPARPNSAGFNSGRRGEP